MADETTTQPQTIDVPTEQVAPPPAQLQLTDILLATQVIQLASSRGAFKVEEFTQIGGVYERLLGFLQATGAITPAPATTDGTTPTAAPTEGN